MNAAILLMMVYWAYKSFGLIGVLGFPAMFLGMLYFRQNGMLYVNAMKSYAMLPSNSHFNLAYEELRIKCADGVHICAWLVTQPGRVGGKNVAPTLIFFHGNAGTIAERLPNTDGLVKQCGCNVLMVEYRGYGTSEGTPSEPGLVADAQGALDALRERSDVDTGKIYVFGRSLGGAVAIKLAHDNPGVLRGVIVENTFTSINSMAMALFPFLQIIPADLCERLLENHWHSDLLIGELDLPMLLLGGKLDEIVPAVQMERLWQLFRTGTGERQGMPPHSEFVEFPTGKHNDTWTVPGYYSNIAKFVKATAAGGAPDTAAAAAAGKDETEAEDDDGWERLDCDVPAADMSVSELRGKLRKRKVAHEHCVEKAELVSLLEESAKTD